LLFRVLRANTACNVGIIVAVAAFVLATGTASAAYLIAGDGTSAASTGGVDPATGSKPAASEFAAEQSIPIAAMLIDPARDPGELDALEQAEALLAAREAQAQAEAMAKAQAEVAAAAQLAAEQQQAAAAQAEQARAAAARQAAATAAVATPAQATVSSALVDARGSIQQAAAAAGWPGELLAKVERVVMCESGGRTNAVSSGGYVGLMQVAPWLHGAVPGDAVGQLAQAYRVYLQQGWSAWPVCGAY
jgi:hypothetical protein